MKWLPLLLLSLLVPPQGISRAAAADTRHSPAPQIYALAASLSGLVQVGNAYEPFQPLEAFEQNRRLGRGVNILGYDPIWRSRNLARFHEKHFRLLKEAGFQSVRVNLYPFRHMNRAPLLQADEVHPPGGALDRPAGQNRHHLGRQDSDFILWNMKTDHWVEPILHALIPKQTRR